MPGRLRSRSNPLWIRAPLILLRYPRLLLAIGFGSLLLAVAVASLPLFISAETGHLVNAAIESPSVTRYGAGVLYTIRDEGMSPSQAESGGGGSSPALQGDRFEAYMIDRRLGPVVAGALGPEMSISAADRPETVSSVAPFAGTEALEHVRVLEGAGTGGIWIDDRTAKTLHVRPGDRISLTSEGQGVVLPVAGIYRSLSGQPATAYWGAWYSSIYPVCPVGDCRVPPPFAIVTPARLPRLFDKLGVQSATYAWQAPVRAGPISWEAAQSLADFEARFADNASRPLSVFECCGSTFEGGHALTVDLSVGMPRVVTEVRRALAGLEGQGRVLQVAGVIVALTVVAVAGAFSISARNVEARLQFARGTPARTVAAMGVLGAVPPTAFGAAAGLGAALALARLVTGGQATAPAVADGARGAAVAVGGSLALLALVTTFAYLRSSESHRARFRALARVPWELGLVGMAVYAYQRVESGEAFVRDPVLRVGRPSVYLLVFPILAIAGLGTVGARVVLALLRWLRARSGRFTSWLYLAVHRLAGGPRLTLLLVSACTLSLGVAIHTQAVVRSLEVTVDAKAGVFVGSDVRARVLYETETPDEFPLPITRVTRVPQALRLTGGRPADLLAVDPDTFASAAFWNPSFADVPLSEITRRLSEPADGRLPIAVVGDRVSVPASLRISGRDVPVRVVARPSAFPGASSLRPLVVVDAETFVRALAGALNPLDAGAGSTEWWVKGPTDEAVGALEASGKPLSLIVTADQVKDIPRIAAVIRTFRVLNVLGLVAALLAVLGMLMYLQARQRSQVVSYGLSLRMGMTHARHRRSLTFELGSMLCSSFVVGLLLALGAALVVARLLDPLESIPPGPLFAIPRGLIGLSFVVVLAVAWLTGWLTNRSARAIDLGEVMRLAE